MISPPPSILAANAETDQHCALARAWLLRLQGKSYESIARSLGVPLDDVHRLLDSSPGDLRRVSSVSLIIPGETVKVLGGYGDETGHVWVQGPRGRYSIPREFLEPVPAPEAPMTKLEAQVKSKKSTRENGQAIHVRTSHASKILEPKLTTGEVLGAPPLASPAQKLEPSERTSSPAAPAIAPSGQDITAKKAAGKSSAPAPEKRPALTPADLTPEQRARWRQSLPTLKETDDDQADNQRIVGGQLTTTEDGRDIIVARDGTMRPAGTDAYRGLRAIAAEQAIQKRLPTGVRLRQNGNMIEVTLIRPSRREAASIRRGVVLQLIETPLDSEFQAVAHKLRATRAEKQLAERVIALRHVGMDHDGREIRARVGVTISEIRSV